MALSRLSPSRSDLGSHIHRTFHNPMLLHTLGCIMASNRYFRYLYAVCFYLRPPSMSIPMGKAGRSAGEVAVVHTRCMQGEEEMHGACTHPLVLPQQRLLPR
jgi:hypothetical protein